MVDCDWQRLPDELLQLPLTRLHLRFADFGEGRWLPANAGCLTSTLQVLELPGCQIRCGSATCGSAGTVAFWGCLHADQHVPQQSADLLLQKVAAGFPPCRLRLVEHTPMSCCPSPAPPRAPPPQHGA